MGRILGEAYAAAHVGSTGIAFPLRSELLAKACAYFGKPFTNIALGEQRQNHRAHRDLVSSFIAQQGVPQSVSPFPLASPTCSIRSAPFSHPVPAANVQLGEPVKEFSPRACLDALLAAVDTREAGQEQNSSRAALLVQDLLLDSFEVVSRNGRHVTLSSGRTSGLTIGSRLVGPNGERLHVIRLLRSSDSVDSAIAFIRIENEKTPLGPGSKLSLDKRLFPPERK